MQLPGGTADVEILTDGGPAAHAYSMETASPSFSCGVPRLLMHHSEQHLLSLKDSPFVDISGFATMGGTSKSSIFIGFSIVSHPFLGVPELSTA